MTDLNNPLNEWIKKELEDDPKECKCNFPHARNEKVKPGWKFWKR